MPQFPHSKYSANPASGVLVRNQGSHSPMVEGEEPLEPNGFLHPFRIKVYVENQITKIKVRAGTVNNVVPKISSKYLDDPTVAGVTVSTTDGIMDVLLKVTKGDSPVFFPTEATIEVSSRPIPTNTDTYGYLVLGSIYFTESGKATVTQQIYSSQIVTRAKPGSATAIWLFSSR